MGGEGLGLGSRSLPLPRPDHRLAVSLARMLALQRSGVLVPTRAKQLARSRLIRSLCSLMGGEGLEPSSLAAHASEACVFANFTTRPFPFFLLSSKGGCHTADSPRQKCCAGRTGTVVRWTSDRVRPSASTGRHIPIAKQSRILGKAGTGADECVFCAGCRDATTDAPTLPFSPRTAAYQ